MKIWIITLSAFLVLNGLMMVTNLRFDYSHLVLGVLSIVAGVTTYLQK